MNTMNQITLSGSAVAMSSAPIAPPIHAPTIGSNVVMPVRMPMVAANGNLQIYSPIVQSVPMTIASINCPVRKLAKERFARCRIRVILS